MRRVCHESEQLPLGERALHVARFLLSCGSNNPEYVNYLHIRTKHVYEQTRLSSYGCLEVYRREIVPRTGLRSQFDATPRGFDRVREEVVPRHLEADERAKLQGQAIEFEQFAIAMDGFTRRPMTSSAGYAKQRQDERYAPGTLYVPALLAARYGKFANILHKYTATAEQVMLDTRPCSDLEEVAKHLCAIVRPCAWGGDVNTCSQECNEVSSPMSSSLAVKYLEALQT